MKSGVARLPKNGEDTPVKTKGARSRAYGKPKVDEIGVDFAGKKGSGISPMVDHISGGTRILLPDRVTYLGGAILTEVFGVAVIITLLGIVTATYANPLFTAIVHGFMKAGFVASIGVFSGGQYCMGYSLFVFLGNIFSPGLDGKVFSDNYGSRVFWGIIYLVGYILPAFATSIVAGYFVQAILGGDSSGLGAPVVASFTANWLAFLLLWMVMTSVIFTRAVATYEFTAGTNVFIAVAFIETAGMLGTFAITGTGLNSYAIWGLGIAALSGYSWAASWVFIVAIFLSPLMAFVLFLFYRVIVYPNDLTYVWWLPRMAGPIFHTIVGNVVHDPQNNSVAYFRQ